MRGTIYLKKKCSIIKITTQKVFRKRVVFCSLVQVFEIKLKLNFAADPEKGFPKKSISKPYDYETAMSTAWELRFI